MSNFNQAISLMLIAFFVYRSIIQFKKVYHYELNKGYQHDTICYMTSPKGFTSNWTRVYLMVSKWIVLLVCVSLFSLIILELINGDMSLALIHGFGMYMIDMVWISVYNYLCGVKIGKKGLIVGIDFIEWSRLDVYALNTNHRKRRFLKSKKTEIRLLVREIGNLRPIWLHVNESNSGLVLSLIKEFMVQ